VACAKQSESYRMLAETVRQRTAAIPLWDAAAEQQLTAEKSQTCFFTGHRDVVGHGALEADVFRQNLREWLEAQVESMVYQGFSTFLCGGARGFDLLAAAAVLQAKQLYHPSLRLVLLLPCREQTRGWNERDLSLHLAVLDRAQAYYLQETYDKSCMHRRNRLLVDLSVTGIAYYDTERERSGTGMTVRYAGSRGVPMLFMPLGDGGSIASGASSVEDDGI